MKITHLLAAATLIAGLGVSTAAAAQDHRHRDYRHERHEARRGWHGYGHDRGRAYGVRNRGRRCHVEHRHHRRVTVCYR